MSKKRQQDVATIDTFLQENDTVDSSPANGTGGDTSDLTPPVPTTPPPKDEPGTLDRDTIAQNLQAKGKAADEDDEENEDDEEDKEEPNPLETTQQLVSAISSTASAVADTATQTTRDVGSVLERISTPGSIFLPIALLLLFYFLIIPVNGYPRIAWLWMVMTNNASLPGGVGTAPFVGGPLFNIAPTTPPTSYPPTSFGPPPPAGGASTQPYSGHTAGGNG